MKFCQEHDLHLISDELYALAAIQSDSYRSKFISVLSLTPDLQDSKALIDPPRVHVVWSASKLFGLSGLRVVSLSLYGVDSLFTTLGLRCIAE